jgi:hypothetical protein
VGNKLTTGEAVKHLFLLLGNSLYRKQATAGPKGAMDARSEKKGSKGMFGLGDGDPSGL